MPHRALWIMPLLCLVAVPVHAQDRTDWSKVEVKLTPVAGRVYVIEDSAGFSGGNIGVSSGPDGILLVDTKFAPLHTKLEAALRTLSERPVRFVVNTHHHGDHTSGNAKLGLQSTIFAHANTRKRLIEDKESPSPPEALPIVTFEDRVRIHLNGDDIDAVHFPNGHTDTDVIVYFRASNVVHMGDTFFNGMFPFIDFSSGGSVKGLIANLEKVLTTLPPNARIIPGHGPLATAADLRRYLDMLKNASAIIEAGVRKGQTAADMKQRKVLAAYDSWSWNFITTDAFIDQLVEGLAPKKR